MYTSRGSNAYGQQQQSNTQSYSAQNLGPDGASQLSVASRHSALLGSRSSAGAHYGGQYTSVYGSAAHDSVLQADIYDRLDATTALRQDLLQTRSLQSASVDGSSRQADYLAARAATVRHAGPEILPYGGRIDADLHTLSMISGTQHTPSILGAAPRREVDDLVYARSSANPGYGVSLPPGRDYVTEKSLHGISLESAYPGGVLARTGYSRLDDHKDDMAYAREIERREEDRLREILRERERERERDRQREKDRDRDREREREREREIERERRRERERILERREKERERDIRRDRTPSRISRDRGRSTSAKRGRSLRRESPRRHSPVKEKRREYVCKVYSSSLVATERDYLSLDKRYSRLFVSPQCSKVIVNWSKGDLNIPFNTPISFEHDFVHEETPNEHESASKAVTNGHVKLESGTTRWNAKMILMSGLSRNAWEELSSERKYDDRIPHLCNMLRFAFLKDGISSMAIGGSWDTVDGNDPSVNNSTLVQTVLRHAKELTGLDLKNCRNWNPFLEIHYDRVGKDGLFSHKEITVLYIPDLSDCLPSIDAWRDQWLAQKKAIAERERLHALKKEKSREKKEPSKDKGPKTKTDLKNVGKGEKKKEPGSASKANGKGKGKGKGKVDTPVKAEKAGKDEDKTVAEKKDGDKTIAEKKDGDKTVTEKKDGDKPVTEKKDGDKTVTKKKDGDKTVAEKKDGDKTVAEKKDGDKTVAEKKDDKTVAEKKDGDKTITEKKDEAETVDEGGNSGKKNQTDSASGTKTPGSGKKKIIRKVIKKKVLVRKDAAKNKPKQDDTITEVISEDAESSGTLTGKTSTKTKAIKKSPVVKAGKKEDEVKEPECSDDKTKKEDAVVKTTAKKKIIKKVTKKSVAAKDVSNKDKVVEGNEARSAASEVKLENNEAVLEDVGGSTKSGTKSEKVQVKEEKKAKVEDGSDKNEKSKGGKEKKDKDVKTETRGKEVKDKKRVEEPPRHPGLFLRTKGNKNSKLRSLSLSLDSLLDYTDKDTEETTFEISLFAETFFEMLQYQMGSRILTFLQKLRIKFVTKRNQKKRQREEASDKKEKEKAKKSPSKRQKTDDAAVESKTVKTETLQYDEKDMVIDNVENTKEEESEKDEDSEEDPEEDPEEPEEESEEEELEEDPEEDEDMVDANPKNDAENEGKAEEKDEKVKSENEDNVKVNTTLEKENSKVDSKKKESLPTIDKELLQAFRFFDRNRVGYIRVEDLRLILHSLGKCMSHRDVKELVQSALLESNSGRDDQILYKKLVKMTDI